MRRYWPLIWCLLAVAACSPSNVHQSDTLVIARAGDAVSLDPAITSGAGDGTILNLCYQTLTAIDPKSKDGSAMGRLATSWTTSADGLTWTFQLNPQARFNDGKPVTADAAAYSFRRVLKVNRAPAQGLFWMKSVEAVDAHTIRFGLNLPVPVLPKLLTLTSGSVLEPALVAAHETHGDMGQAWLSEHCAGAGPYTVADWQRGQRLTLERAPNGAGAYFKRVVFKVVPDEASRRLQLIKGDVDFIDSVGAASATHYAHIDGVVLESVATDNVLAYLTLNNQRGPLADVRVRRAIADAIDYQAMRDKVLNGNVTLLNGLIPPGVPGYDPGLPEPRRDLASAKTLLAAAGFAKGIDLTMSVGQVGPVAELIQSNLAAAGIRITLQRLAPSAIDDARSSGSFDILYDGIVMDFPDPFIFLNLVFSSPEAGGVANFSRYRSATTQTLLNTAMVASDPAQRAALYNQAQHAIMKDEPIVMLFSPKTIVAHRASLTNVSINFYQPNYLDIAAMGRN